jgi:hypothetical protein
VGSGGFAEACCRYFLGFPIALKSDDAADTADERSEANHPVYVSSHFTRHTSHVTRHTSPTSSPLNHHTQLLPQQSPSLQDQDTPRHQECRHWCPPFPPQPRTNNVNFYALMPRVTGRHADGSLIVGFQVIPMSVKHTCVGPSSRVSRATRCVACAAEAHIVVMSVQVRRRVERR